MAEATADHIRTVDDLFQELVLRVPRYEARNWIFQWLQVGELLIDSHVAATVTRNGKKSPTRKESSKQHWANPEEPAEVPAGGITKPVDPQSWGRVCDLSIRGHHLVIEPICGFDFPWDAYSFSVANLAAVPKLLARIGKPMRPADARPTPTPIADEERPSRDATKVAQLEGALDRLDGTDELAGLRGKRLLNRLCDEVGPNFSAGMTTLKVAKRRRRQKIVRSAQSRPVSPSC